MSFCPNCHEEYEGGVEECFDCGVRLVESLDESSKTSRAQEYLTFRAGSANDLAVMKEALERWDVPCRLAASAGPDGIEEGDASEEHLLAVPAQFGEKAMRVLAQLTHLGWSPGAEGPTDEAQAADDGAPANEPSHELIESASLLEQSLTEIARRGDEVIDELLKLVAQGSAGIQKKAARALVFMGPKGEDALIELMKVALENARMETVTTLLAALREAEYAGPAWRELRPYLQREAAIRIKTLEILSHLGELGTIPDIMPYLSDPDPAVRDEADNALCMLSDEDMGFDGRAAPEEREQCIALWKEWWREIA